MLERLKIRNPNIDEDIANELLKTAKDRILLRVESRQTIFPVELESICVEVVTAMYNRSVMNHEGIQSESVDVFSVTFIKSLLDEYEREFNAYRNMRNDEEDSSLGKVRFL